MSALGASSQMAGFQRQGNISAKHTQFHESATHGVPPVGRWVLAAAAAMSCAEIRQICHGSSHGRCGDFFEAFLLHRPLFRLPAVKLLIAITELLTVVHPRTYEAVMWRQSPRDFIAQIKRLEKIHSAPPAGEAGDPALRELIMADVDETTSALPASQAELPTSEDTAPCTTPRTFMRTITSFQDPAGWLSGSDSAANNQGDDATLTAPHGSREEQTPANKGLPASLPLSAPPGRRAGGPEPDSPMTGENYALSAQSMSRHCMQGLTKHSESTCVNTQVTATPSRAGGTNWMLTRCSSAIPTLYKAKVTPGTHGCAPSGDALDVSLAYRYVVSSQRLPMLASYGQCLSVSVHHRTGAWTPW